MSSQVSSTPLVLTVNGEARSFTAPLSVAALLDSMGLTGKRLAVECNGEIVPKGRHAEAQLADGDRLEIVVAVGGG
ncbi:MAG: sulfur carrier protein ThiS [Rhodocyclaceae bacterium]|nr:MAG: sulfur carrier protein ThiS [Rhodocyclaceae bacterium]